MAQASTRWCCHNHLDYSIHQWAPTWFHIQRVLIDGQVHGLVGCVTEVFQDKIDSGSHATRHRFPKFHPTVDHNAAVSEVQNLQVLKVTQVGLQVGHKLGKDFKKCNLILQTNNTTMRIMTSMSNCEKFTSSRKRCSKALYSGELLLKRSSEKIMFVTLRLKNTISARPGFTGRAILAWSVPCATPNGNPVLPSSVWLISP